MSQPSGSDPLPGDEMRQIPKWARRYAQNRTLPVILAIVGILVTGLPIGALGALAGIAVTNGQWWQGAAWGAAFVAYAMWWQRFAKRIVPRITTWLYGDEGNVTLTSEPEVTGIDAFRAPDILFFACFMLQVSLDEVFRDGGLWPARYIQPISALYVVPYLFYLSMAKRWMFSSPFMVLWPVLYALHAVLILVGVPIWLRASGPLTPLNMGIPYLAYALISAAVAHLYSRFALRRLRRLAAAPGGHDLE